MKRTAMLLVACVLLGLGGCATMSPAERQAQMVRADGLTVGDLWTSLKSGRSQAEIIGEVKAKGLRATPSSGDLEMLSQNGASAELLETITASGERIPVPVAGSAPYYYGPGWWPYAGFSYWSGYPYGYAYGPGFYRPGIYGSYYSRPYVNSYRGPSGGFHSVPGRVGGSVGGGGFSSPYRSSPPRSVFRRR